MYYNTDKKPLIVKRTVWNGEDLYAWAESVGIPNLVPARKLHTTVLYSKAPVNWYAINDFSAKGLLYVEPKNSRIEILSGAVVLSFDSHDLKHRWEQAGKWYGTSWDYDDYIPHITLSYTNEADIDPAKIVPFCKPLILGPEHMEGLDPNWEENKANALGISPVTELKNAIKTYLDAKQEYEYGCFVEAEKAVEDYIAAENVLKGLIHDDR